jgi:hypothetical protein
MANTLDPSIADTDTEGSLEAERCINRIMPISVEIEVCGESDSQIREHDRQSGGRLSLFANSKNLLHCSITLKIPILPHIWQSLPVRHLLSISSSALAGNTGPNPDSISNNTSSRLSS